ncbi:penicillin-binding protein, beta-lactamase class C [Rheinheimera sp. A13L]|uniref:serine hydrolase domain-containing protein n=1 Tax=Rheinheimera sp. A13L TaxID=506534 RepID=UPI0002124F33|nr:serine hydrolase domain-containing protein [Rheinheimera sp. A13L]EGM75967.1 penicillin-binding protein, beta-lactamase class C [Rheinheimera sp. A13L]
MKIKNVLFSLLCCVSSAVLATEPYDRIAPLVEKAIADKQLPGAVVLVGRGEQILYRKAFGFKTYSPAASVITPDTVFDLASLTKPVVTTTLIMQLVEQGELRLTDPVGKYLQQLNDADVKKITILQLLTHSSGLADGFNRREFWQGKAGLDAALAKLQLKTKPDQQFVYSDLGFILLGLVVEKITKQPLDFVAQQRIFQPLKMKDSRYLPLERPSQDTAYLQRVAPTENLQGDADYQKLLPNYAQPYLHAVVHDPTALRLGGVAGHAGVFGTADDLALFAQMLLNGGELKGQKVLSPLAVQRLLMPVVIEHQSRALGWDMQTAYSAPKGDLLPPGSFGHTGFTGTSIWIDPASRTYIILLSNRVHPNRDTSITELRAKLANIVASAVGLAKTAD